MLIAMRPCLLPWRKSSEAVVARRTLSDLDETDHDDEGERQEFRCGEEVLHSGGRLHAVAVHKRQQDCRDREKEQRYFIDNKCVHRMCPQHCRLFTLQQRTSSNLLGAWRRASTLLCTGLRAAERFSDNVVCSHVTQKQTLTRLWCHKRHRYFREIALGQQTPGKGLVPLFEAQYPRTPGCCKLQQSINLSWKIYICMYVCIHTVGKLHHQGREN